MNQMTDVKSILRRTATDGTEVPTGFAYESARQGVGHVLSQIENQVLAQRMVFDFDDGTRLACIASGRRLVRLFRGPFSSRCRRAGQDGRNREGSCRRQVL